MKLLVVALICSMPLMCVTNTKQRRATQKQILSPKQDSIVDRYLTNGAWKKNVFSQEYQAEIDLGIKEDSTIAYLWQQKAMPLFKQRKYELGMHYLDRAVQLDTFSYLPYRAFMKCIFTKEYRSSLNDFQACKILYGNNFVMDHSFDFYMAVCYLQLNQFDTAELLLQEGIDRLQLEGKADWIHHLDLFYLGISQFEQGKLDSALTTFESALKNYPQFSDVKFYMSQIYQKKGNSSKAALLLNEAEKDYVSGYTINEDNEVYERYPYQVNWGYKRSLK